MSLLSGIWDGIVGWVEDLIDSATAWLGSKIAWLRGAWDNFTTKTLPDIWRSLQENANNIVSALENAAGSIVNKVENFYTEVHNHITNFNTIRNEFVTNIIGASKEWVLDQGADIRGYIDNRLLTYAPQGFQSNPEEYVKTHADERYLAGLFKVMESFGEGFVEGLEEEG